MPVWTIIDVDGSAHYADLPLAVAHLDDVLRIGTPAELTALDGRSPLEQSARSRQLAVSLAAAFRAMNLNPWRTPVWRGAWRSEYAPAGSTAVPLASPTEQFYTGITRATGWMAWRAFSIYTAVTSGEAREENTVVERMSLTPAGEPAVLCGQYTDADEVCGRFAPGTLYVGRAAPAGAACSDPNDWRCASWNDAPLQPLRLSPPLRWSAEAFVQIAGQMRADLVAQIKAAVREARAAGASASISPPGVVPTHPVPDNPRAVRGGVTLFPVIVPPGPPRRGPSVGDATFFDPGSATPVGAPINESTCSSMPRLGTGECRDFLSRNLTMAERVLRPAAARAVFGDATRGAELGPLDWDQLWQIAQATPGTTAQALWRQLAWNRCMLPPAGFATTAERQVWMAANSWCDPARVPVAADTSLVPGSDGTTTTTTTTATGRPLASTSSGPTLVAGLVIGAAVIAGGAWLLLHKPPTATRARRNPSGRRRRRRAAAAATA